MDVLQALGQYGVPTAVAFFVLARVEKRLAALEVSMAQLVEVARTLAANTNNDVPRARAATITNKER